MPCLTEQERMAYQKSIQPFNLPGTLGSAPDLAEVILDHKGIVLSSLLEDQRVAQATLDPELKKLLDEKQGASRQLNKLQNELPVDTSPEGWKKHHARRKDAQDKANALQRELARRVAGYGQARQSLTITAEDVQEALPASNVLVEFIRYSHHLGKGGKDGWDARYGAVVLGKEDGPVWVPLGSAKAIDSLVAHSSPMVKVPVEKYEAVLRGLYTQVMAPVVKALPKGTKTLILCPDSSLNFLSFHTLLNEKNRFLCEDFEIRHVSTGRDLVPMQDPQDSTDTLVAFARPAYDEKQAVLRASAKPADQAIRMRSMERNALRDLSFTDLPGTLKEAEFLQSRARSWKLQPMVRLGREATEAALTTVDSPRILHLATHGFFHTKEEQREARPRSFSGFSSGQGIAGTKGPPPVNPMQRSGLAFAGANLTAKAWKDKDSTPPSTANDGILTATEASVLNLKGTWMVVLSACKTGQGESRSGEGVLGLRRAFIQAGAENLLMTLWPVSDKYTVKFMESFYPAAMATGDAPGSLDKVQREKLMETRKLYGTRIAVLLYGPFVMNFTNRR